MYERLLDFIRKNKDFPDDHNSQEIDLNVFLRIKYAQYKLCDVGCGSGKCECAEENKRLVQLPGWDFLDQTWSTLYPEFFQT